MYDLLAIFFYIYLFFKSHVWTALYSFICLKLDLKETKSLLMVLFFY